MNKIKKTLQTLRDQVEGLTEQLEELENKLPENRHFGEEINPDLTHVLGYHEDDIMDRYEQEYTEELLKDIDAYLRARITESELIDKINILLECAAELVAEDHVPEGTHHEHGEY